MYSCCRSLPCQQRIGHVPEEVSGQVVTGHVFSLLDDEISVSTKWEVHAIGRL